MCGVAGLIQLNGKKIEASLIEKMTLAVAHRGPDGEGFMIEGNVALGHRRLAIVDLSNDGAQPMTDNSGKNTVIFNGEIYNYLELKAELKMLGHVFSTTTDTEVLLTAYSEWGDACVQRFNGMWSFAIYDRIKGRIFCSRDRFGEKPFYYLHGHGWFAFGSEIRQLLPFLPARRANTQALIKFIMGIQAEELERTFFDEINKLPGGHNLILDLRTYEMVIKRYYELKIDSSLGNVKVNEAVNQFSELLSNSVEIRLRADVAIGTCLSGGLDSSSIATLASNKNREFSQKPFLAITASSEEKDNDETVYAEKIVNHNKLIWHKIRPSYDDFSASLPSIVDAQEEPFPSASIAMQYFVMQCAKQNKISVLLDGQGGDEILLGYERYFAAHYLDRIRTDGFMTAMQSMLSRGANNANMSPWRMAGYFIYFNSQNIRWFNYQRRHSYIRHFPEMFDEVRMYAEVSGNVQELQKLEIERTNLPALLRYEDKNSMRHGVEARLPFLDYRLVEYCLSLPGSLKISDGWTKYILRRSMSGKMPDSITWRRNKFGFEAPEALWFAHHKDLMLEEVRNSVLLSYLCDKEKLISEFSNLDTLTRWRLYSVSCWERSFEVGI